MKTLLWMMLATLPTQAMANNEDPIAYKCYYCTPAEMEDVALAQGVGRHYVYDYSNLGIFGFEVERAGSNLIAKQFAAESWVERQFKGMIGLYNIESGYTFIHFPSAELLAPGTEHGKSTRMLWAHHLSELNPHHEAARETVRRHLTTRPELAFLDTTESGGRLLRFAHSIEGSPPMLAIVGFGDPLHWGYGHNTNYMFNHTTRQWEFFSAQDGHPVQHSREDFARWEGNHHFSYTAMSHVTAPAFAERARWAGVPVHGVIPGSGRVEYRCERSADDIQCYID